MTKKDLKKVRDYVYTLKDEPIENPFLEVDKAVNPCDYLLFVAGEITFEELYDSQGEMLLTFDLINNKIKTNYDK